MIAAAVTVATLPEPRATLSSAAATNASRMTGMPSCSSVSSRASPTPESSSTCTGGFDHLAKHGTKSHNDGHEAQDTAHAFFDSVDHIGQRDTHNHRGDDVGQQQCDEGVQLQLNDQQEQDDDGAHHRDDQASCRHVGSPQARRQVAARLGGLGFRYPDIRWTAGEHRCGLSGR